MWKICFISQFFMSSVVLSMSCPFVGVNVLFGGEGRVCFVLVLFLVGRLICFLVFYVQLCILTMMTASLRLSFPNYDSTRHIKI